MSGHAGDTERDSGGRGSGNSRNNTFVQHPAARCCNGGGRRATGAHEQSDPKTGMGAEAAHCQDA
jgi:hypothetical protein